VVNSGGPSLRGDPDKFGIKRVSKMTFHAPKRCPRQKIYLEE